MEEMEDKVRLYALRRVGDVFNIRPASLPLGSVFGEDLKATFISDFKRNELSRILDDIWDVADRQVAEELKSGVLVIRTVRDYCDYMVRCYGTRPKDVRYVLGIEEV